MKTIREDLDELMEDLKKIKIETIKMKKQLDKQKTREILLGICLFLSFLLIFILFLM